MSRLPLGTGIDRQGGFHGACAGLQDFDVEPARQLEPVRPGGQRFGAPGGGTGEYTFVIVDHDAEMGETPLWSDEIRIFNELHASEHPNLTRARTIGGLLIAIGETKHLTKEVDVTINVRHTDRDVFDISAGQ